MRGTFVLAFTCSVNVFGLVAANAGPTERQNNAGLVPLCPPDVRRTQRTHSPRTAPLVGTTRVLHGEHTHGNRATHGFVSEPEPQ